VIAIAITTHRYNEAGDILLPRYNGIWNFTMTYMFLQHYCILMV